MLGGTECFYIDHYCHYYFNRHCNSPYRNTPVLQTSDIDISFIKTIHKNNIIILFKRCKTYHLLPIFSQTLMRDVIISFFCCSCSPWWLSIYVTQLINFPVVHILFVKGVYLLKGYIL